MEYDENLGLGDMALEIMAGSAPMVQGNVMAPARVPGSVPVNYPAQKEAYAEVSLEESAKFMAWSLEEDEPITESIKPNKTPKLINNDETTITAAIDKAISMVKETLEALVLLKENTSCGAIGVNMAPHSPSPKSKKKNKNKKDTHVALRGNIHAFLKRVK